MTDIFVEGKKVEKREIDKLGEDLVTFKAYTSNGKVYEFGYFKETW